MLICLISCKETLKKGVSRDQIIRAAYGPSTGITDPVYNCAEIEPVKLRAM